MEKTNSNYENFSTGANIVNSKMNGREEVLKTSITYEDFRKDATYKEIKLRKDEREKRFKERRLQQQLNIEVGQSFKSHMTIGKELFDDCDKMKVSDEDLPHFINLVKSQDLKVKYMGLVGVRKILSLKKIFPIQTIIDQGLMVEFINYLDCKLPEFQFEALWCLTNIAGGTSEHTRALASKGAIDKIVFLFDSEYQEIQDQALWTIGNIACDSLKLRDQIIKKKGLEKIIKYLSTADRTILIKTAVWAVSSFCHSTPPPDFELMRPLIDLISKAIYKLHQDYDFLSDALWILYYLTEHHKKSIRMILKIGIVPKLIPFLDCQSPSIQLPTLRILGNIVAGNANQTQLVVDAGILNQLKNTIYHERKSVRKETCWILSNIAAGTQLQIEAVIAAGFLPILEYLIRNDLVEIQKEAIWAACNLSSTTNQASMEVILDQGILEIICNCLRLPDPKFMAVSLEALSNLLQYGSFHPSSNGVNLIVNKIEKLGMFDFLESLQFHPDEIVYEKTIKLLELYFNTEI